MTPPPAPESVTSFPDGTSAAPTPSPVPVHPLAVTPPAAPKSSLKLSASFAKTAEIALKGVSRKPSKASPGMPPTPPADQPYLQRCAPQVRVLLVVTELVSNLRFEAGSRTAKLWMRDLAGDKKLLELRRPDDAKLISMTVADGGIGAVRRMAALREDHRDEVVACDGDIDVLFLASAGLDEMRVPNTQFLLQAVVEVAGVAAHWFKQCFDVPRPYELLDLGDTPAPMLAHPGHSSFPGGHATQAYALAAVLRILLAARLQSGGFEAVAELVARSREYAGLHFPLDTTEGGGPLGAAIAAFVIAMQAKPDVAPMLSTLWALASKEIAAASA